MRRRLIQAARQLIGRIGPARRIHKRLKEAAWAPGLLLLPKGKIDIREGGPDVRMPDPLSPEYGSVAARIAAQRLRQARFGLSLRRSLRIPRAWQLRVLARSHTLVRALTMGSRTTSRE